MDLTPGLMPPSVSLSPIHLASSRAHRPGLALPWPEPLKDLPCRQNLAVTEIEVSKVAASSIEQVYADPAGHHVLLLMKVNNTYETHYMHR